MKFCHKAVRSKANTTRDKADREKHTRESAHYLESGQLTYFDASSRSSEELNLFKQRSLIMDPVGGLASIVTLAGTALAVGKIGLDLVQAFQDAPQELGATVSKIRVIQFQLEQLAQIGIDMRKTDDQLLSSQFSQTIQSALEVSKHTLITLQNALPPTTLLTNRRSRLRWVLLERTKVNQHKQRLQHIQQDLGLALQILDMHVISFYTHD